MVTPTFIPVKRVRVLLGPNGSGKSSVFAELSKLVPTYDFINPDNIKVILERDGFYPLACPVTEDVIAYIQGTTYSDTVKKLFAEKVLVRDGKIYFEPDAINTYAIAALAEFLRYLYLTNGLNFTIETVFSHPSKLAFLQQAQDHGYRIYLYFVATENPELNVKRVRQRVAEGGHDIPPAKIIERYERCLDNFYPALQFAYRAFFWDNSDKRPLLFAEMTPDRQVSVLANLIPGWFQRCVLAKMVAEG